MPHSLVALLPQCGSVLTPWVFGTHPSWSDWRSALRADAVPLIAVTEFELFSDTPKRQNKESQQSSPCRDVSVMAGSVGRICWAIASLHLWDSSCLYGDPPCSITFCPVNVIEGLPGRAVTMVTLCCMMLLRRHIKIFAGIACISTRFLMVF